MPACWAFGVQFSISVASVSPLDDVAVAVALPAAVPVAEALASTLAVAVSVGSSSSLLPHATRASEDASSSTSPRMRAGRAGRSRVGVRWIGRIRFLRG